MTTRLNDWPARLLDYLTQRRGRAFEWGPYAHDCCSFGAGGVAAITGRDVMADVPAYSSAAEPATLLQQQPLSEWLDERFPRRPVGLARRGDIALATLKGQDTVMIVEGDTLVGPGARGLVRLPRSEMRAAWAV